MGIEETTGAGFSDDVLKVEISGPDKPELTLVDLPGLYYSTSKDQGVQGIAIVRNLTERYMKNARSIILAVISAKTDYHLQEVLNIAERFDPKRDRTLGIITQPDVLEANSEEEETYLQFVKNEKIHLQLGWHVLRNRSFEFRDISDDVRDEREKQFFESGRWATVSRTCVGINSLRQRLSSVLLKHIKHNLPGLIADVKAKMIETQSSLAKLGAARSTIQEQKGFLLGISSSFERIVGQALNGMCADEFFGGLDVDVDTKDLRRLRAVVRELNEDFATAMDHRGCRRTIVNTPFDDTPQDISNTYLDGWKPSYITRSTLEAEVCKQAQRNRGIELPGNANQLLVGSLFRDQSKPWKEVARCHLMTVWESARYFVYLLLQHLTDEHTYSLLSSSILDPALEKMRDALLNKLDELTAYTERGHPLPLGKSYLTQIQKSRTQRQMKALEAELGISVLSNNDDSTKAFSLQDLQKATSELESSSNEFAAAEIIDQMQAYYDTAIVTFVDNVATLAIENCLLGPLESIFTSLSVNNLPEVQIEDIASEPAVVGDERKRLLHELEKLQAGLSALSSYNTFKPDLGTPRILVQRGAPSSADSVFSQYALQTPKPLSNGGLPGSTSQKADKALTTPKSASGSLSSVRSQSPSTSVQSGSSISTTKPASGALFGADASAGGFGVGSQSSSAGGFGVGSQSSSTSGFGARWQSSSANGYSGFGASTTTPASGGLFGGGKSLFGGNNQHSSTINTGAFGAFGAPAGSFPFSAKYDATKAPSTKDINWDFIGKTNAEEDNTSNRINKYEHISYLEPYKDYSPEELRLGDYARWR